MVVMRGCRGGTPPPKFSEGSPPHDRRQCRETFPDAVTALRRARWGRPRVTGGGDCESQPIGGQCQLFSGARRRRNLEPVGGCGVVKRIMTVAAGRCCVFVHALRTVAPRPKEFSAAETLLWTPGGSGSFIAACGSVLHIRGAVSGLGSWREESLRWMYRSILRCTATTSKVAGKVRYVVAVLFLVDS